MKKLTIIRWVGPWKALLLLYAVLFPFVTYALLVVRGLPDAAVAHPLITLNWVIHVTWIPAIIASVLLTIIAGTLRPYLYYFTQPYDFGRSFSLGAVSGAIVQAFATDVHRTLSHNLFSDSWIAGATIAGCVTGALTTALFFWHWSVQKAVLPKPKLLETSH